MLIGQKVVHLLQARTEGKPHPPADLHGRRLEGKNSQTITRGMGSQVDQNIDAIGTHLLGDGLVRHPHAVTPVVGVTDKPLSDQVFTADHGIDENLNLTMIMLAQQRLSEMHANMVAKIRGDITDAQTSSGRLVIGIREVLPRGEVVAHNIAIDSKYLLTAPICMVVGKEQNIGARLSGI